MHGQQNKKLRGVGFIPLISIQEPLNSLIELLCKYSNFDILKVLPFVTFIHLIIVIPLLLLRGPNTYLSIVYAEPWNSPILLAGKFQVLQKKCVSFVVVRCQFELLGTFATLQKVTMWFVIFVCLYVTASFPMDRFS
jgi:hypothetical protein